MRWQNGWVERKRWIGAGRRPAPRDRHREETGFSLIEVVVAVTVLTLVFFAVEWASAQTTTASVAATQQAAESSLASQAIAEARALPFADLQAGANAANLAAALNGSHTAMVDWPQVSYSAGSYTLTLPGLTPPVGTILATNTAAAEAPLVPFSSTESMGKVTYDVAVFTTPTIGNPNLVTVTAIVERVLANPTATTTSCPSAPSAPGATTTTCGDLVAQVELGPQ